MISRARTPQCGMSANSWVLHDQYTCQGKWNSRTLNRCSQTEGLHSCHHHYLSLCYISVETTRRYVTNDQSTRRQHQRRQISHCCYSFRYADTVVSDCRVQWTQCCLVEFRQELGTGASVILRCSLGCSDLREGNCNECWEILLAW